MPDSSNSMTPGEIEILAHNIRLQIQAETCCPRHAGEVLMLVMSGFALDDAQDDSHKAAASMLKAAREWATRVRTGRFVVLRNRQ